MLSKKLVNGDGFHCFLLCAPISPYKLNQLNMTVVDNCLNEYSRKSADGKIQILKKRGKERSWSRMRVVQGRDDNDNRLAFHRSL